MNEMNPKVDLYLKQGCMRCSLGGTPACKVHSWPEELVQLRRIVLDSGLTEQLKWSMPVYTVDNRNIVLVSAFKEYCALSFFKGALLKDPRGVLITQTENTQAARQIRFTDVGKIIEMEPILRAYIAEAIEVERSGLKVEKKKNDDFAIPEELQSKFEEHPELMTAFEALTPGRQRGYILHFSAPKQSKTRASRIEKCVPQILQGKGLYDR